MGSHLIQQLVAAGKPVRAIYRSAIPQFHLAASVEWVKGDILDVVSLAQAMEGVEQVYHCAAMVSFNPARKQEMHQINVQGTAQVVDACIEAGIKRLLFVSSVAALGRIR